MGVTTTQTNKPFNPRGNDQSPKGYNRAKLYSGKALDFDGVNDLVTMPTALTSSLSTTSVTFVTNLKTDFATWAGTRDDAFSFAERGMILSFNGGNIYYYYRHQSSGWRNLQVPNADFKTQEWNQMVTTIDLNADTWKAYVNGVEVASSGTYSDTAIAYDANALTIGAQAGARFFDGQIAGFKIFNTALTAAQVADLYNNPEKVVPTGVDNTALKLWLPMMEGAGTTAYDGSGNGNHGTISGATYVNGIGAPVAQSAVMDWNKNKNSITNSTDFSAAAGWTILNNGGGTSVVTNGYAESPYGGQTAARLQATKGTGYGLISFTPAVSTSGTYVNSVWAKSNTGSTQNVAMYSRNSASNYQSVTTEWTRFEFTGSGTSNYFNIGSFGTSDASVDILLWGAQMVLDASEAGPYTPTIGTAQPTPVLLPQGLTTGRDITGVNLFENVRKQGALNLDGNSWAEVHDNESVDLTDNFTLEAWIKDEGIGDTGILGKWYGASNEESYLLYRATDNRIRFYVFTNAAYNIQSITTMTTGNWYHIVGTYDGSNFKIYMNGTLETTAARTGNVKTTSKELEIGRYYDNSLYSYNDQIAQPRIYNRALTAEEVQRNYNAGKNTYTN